MFSVVYKNGETWLICGGRGYADKEMFDSAMHDFMAMRGCPSRIVHGAASGADTMAGDWGTLLAIDVCAVPVDHDFDGPWPAAGPRRNQRMLDKYPVDFVIAFPGGKGTADMMRRARKAGIDVGEVKPVTSHA